MHPLSQASNAPTKQHFKGIYLGKQTEASLREWSQLTQQNYNTVKSRFRRTIEQCPYSRSSRVEFYRHHAFFQAINKKQSFDNLVIYSSEDFLERVSWVLSEFYHQKIHHKTLIEEKRKQVNSNLDKGISLSEILKELFYDYNLPVTEEYLTSFKEEFFRNNPKYKTLNFLAFCAYS